MERETDRVSVWKRTGCEGMLARDLVRDIDVFRGELWLRLDAKGGVREAGWAGQLGDGRLRLGEATLD